MLPQSFMIFPQSERKGNEDFHAGNARLDTHICLLPPKTPLNERKTGSSEENYQENKTESVDYQMHGKDCPFVST